MSKNSFVLCSIIITHHKRIDLLRQQLSAYAEWLREDKFYEFIVVDNSDLEERDQNLLKNDFPWVSFIFLTKNLGPSQSRNFGIQACNGELIQFIDDDDLITFEKLEFQTRYLSNHPEVDVIVGGTLKVKWSSDMLPVLDESAIRFPKFEYVKECNELLDVDGFFQIGAALFRKDALIKIGGFDENLFMIEDVNLYIRLFSLGSRIQVIRDSPFGLFWRVHANATSLSHSNQKVFLEGCLVNFMYCINHQLLKSEKDYREVFTGIYNIGKSLYGTKSRMFPKLVDTLAKLNSSQRKNLLPEDARFSLLIGFELLFNLAYRYRKIKNLRLLTKNEP